MKKLLFAMLSVVAMTMYSCGSSEEAKEPELKYIEGKDISECYNNFNNKWRGKTMKEFVAVYGKPNSSSDSWGQDYYSICKMPNPDGGGFVYYDLNIDIDNSSRQIIEGKLGRTMRMDNSMRW